MIEEKVTQLLEPILEKLGYGLVQVRMFGSGKFKTLQVMAERNDGTSLAMNDLQSISKSVSDALDEANVIETRYNLEVSSPGLDRPLVKHRDYERNIGVQINIRLRRGNDKGRKFKGVIVSVKEDGFTFKPENFEENFEIDFSDVDFAKLVITDEMFGKGKKKKF